MVDSLVQSAKEARQLAYAPYSGYLVGAAVETLDGHVFTGCNVENLSYGATICAERTAIVKMASEGFRAIRRVAVSTLDGGTPCGICLQVLLEFAPEPSNVEVLCIGDTGKLDRFLLSELCPHGFSSKAVPRTESASNAV